MRIIKILLLFFLALAYLRGLFIPIMNYNAAHHANIALHMYLTGDYVNLIDEGKDYLDKPHLLFWLASISYKIFGVSSFAYKFASFVFALIGIYSVYRLGKLVFGEKTGIISVLIFSSAFAFILSVNDVRMDAMLVSCIAFATWQLFEYFFNKTRYSFFLAALGLALGFSTKGIVAIAMPVMVTILYQIQLYGFKNLQLLKWSGLAIVTLLLLVPVFYCFYLQFDLHPEKIIRGRSGYSGIYFLLFGQSVDRYSGTGWGRRATGPLFLVHNFLWAYLPWCILAFIALIKNIREWFKVRFKFNRDTEFAFTITTTVMYILVSGSQFKNPHYINILFPYFALITARFLVSEYEKFLKSIFLLQLSIVALMVIGIIAINTWFFPVKNIFIAACAILIIVLLYFTIKEKNFDLRSRIVWLSFGGSVFTFFLLNFNFYPQLLQYQSGHIMADSIKAAGIDPHRIYYIKGGERNFSMQFSLHTIMPEAPVDSLKRLPSPVYVFAGSKDCDTLRSRNILYDTILKKNHYNVSTLRFNFVNPATRDQTLKPHYILKIRE